jgi:hypothetical protein
LLTGSAQDKENKPSANTEGGPAKIEIIKEKTNDTWWKTDDLNMEDFSSQPKSSAMKIEEVSTTKKVPE